ncbi:MULTISPECIES: pyruvate dehydrogenase (acetyl-transferring) E1 component subunit alpha [unclassified Streptomyces]|uniref:pyruvate dehydrogenase (acetyl-transferring) E1 component subunit alpha n=1 Tax=unclassified Streptomyces TaxID=2593676 RepID=UPI00352F7AA5
MKGVCRSTCHACCRRLAPTPCVDGSGEPSRLAIRQSRGRTDGGAHVTVDSADSTAAAQKAQPPRKRTAAKKSAKKSPGKTPAKTTAAKAPAKTTAKAGAPQSDLVQLLTPEGKRVKNAEYDRYVADITDDELRALYRDMVLTRRFDAEATALQRQGELGLWASLLGQEAAQIGSGRATREDDYVFPTYREHGVAWCRGVDPTNLLGMFRGVNHGGWDPNSNNFHLYTIVIGSQTLHATGYAMGVAKDGADSAVIAYFGDGASSQGDVLEAFNFGAVYNAPVVFFCQNNQWAISEPTERQMRVPLYQRAQGFGFPGVRVDGNDVLACLAVTRWALDRARQGEGPALIEAFTYRMGAHTTSDDPSKYRSDDERVAWEAKDPILRLRAYLESQTDTDEGFFAELDAESETLGKRVRDVVRAMPDPDLMAIFENVYADGHALVDEERAQFAAYQASFADGEA